MRVNDNYLDAAQSVLGSNAGGLMNDGKVPSVYNGYVAAFGGSMVQPGLYATVISYYADDKKSKVANLIFDIYRKVNDPDFENWKSAFEIQKLEKAKTEYNTNLAKINRTQRPFRNNIAQSVIALKLVLRTFGLENENEEE